MKSTILLKIFSLVAILVLLTACGGGNSSPRDTPKDYVGGSFGRDATPDQFSFEEKKGAPVGIVVESSTITVTGINQAVPISIIGGQYRINSGSYTAAEGRVSSGDKVTLQVRSPSVEDASHEAVLTIGSVSAVFRVSSVMGGTLPGAIDFKPVTNAAPGTVVESNEVVVSGIAGAVTINIDGGQYAIDNGSYTASSGTIAEGQSLRVRLTSASDFGESRSATLTVGRLSTSFTVTTRVSPDVLDLGIIFPPKNALTDAKRITVRGVASSAAAIESVLVNGVEASSRDGFHTWLASVELADGQNKIEAIVKDTAGNIHSQSASLRNAPVLHEVGQLVLSEDGAKVYLSQYTNTGMELLTVDRSTGDAQRLLAHSVSDMGSFRFDVDSAGQRLVLAGNTSDYNGRLVELDIRSGVRNVLYEGTPSDSASTVQLFDNPIGIIPHPGHPDSVLVIDEGRQELLSLNLNTGQRTLVAGRDRGRNISARIDKPRHVMPYPGDTTRVLVSDACFCRDGVVVYDLTTGNRTAVNTSRDILYSGTQGIAAYPGDSDRVIVADPRERRLFSVSMTSPEETVVSSSTSGSGTRFVHPWGIVAHPALADTVVVSDSEAGLLLAVNVSTGDRSVLSGAGTGAGSSFEEPRGLIVNPADAGQLLVVDNAVNAVFSVDINTGNRTVISGFDPTVNEYVGSGLSFFSPQGISIDPRNSDSVLVTDGGNGGVYSVNLGNGHRQNLGSQIGAYEALGPTSAMELDSTGNRAYVLHPRARAMVEHRLDDGTRRIVASGLSSPVDIVIDEYNERIYVIGEQPFVEMISFDGDSRRIVSGWGVGGGPEPARYSRLVIDPKNETIFLISQNNDDLYRVDIATGDRTLVPMDSGVLGWFDLALDANHNTVVGLAYSVFARLFDVNLDSGEIKFFDHFNLTQVAEPRLYMAGELAYLPSTQMLLVADPVGASLHIVSPKDGFRHSFPVNVDDVATSSPFSVLPHPLNSELVLIGFTGRINDSIYAADLKSGEIHLVSGDGSESGGAGPHLRSMKQLTYFPRDPTRILAWTSNGRAIAVDLSSGDRTEINTSLDSINGLMVRPDDSSQVFAVEGWRDDQLVSLDIESGQKTVISSSSVGAGTPLGRPWSVSAHPSIPDQALVGLEHNYEGAIVSVDLLTGDRTLVSGGGVGLGPRMLSPESITHSHLKPGTIWVSDRYVGIFEVDLISGDRVILSR